MSIFVTKNFKRSEFACPCCNKDRPLDPKLIFLLQSLRDKIGKAVYISRGGGLRCKIYNKKIGGYVNSPHLLGKAVDIHAKNMSLIQLARLARDIGFTRVGIYPHSYFIHIDTYSARPNASWIRDIQGRYIYFRKLEEAIEFISKEKS